MAYDYGTTDPGQPPTPEQLRDFLSRKSQIQEEKRSRMNPRVLRELDSTSRLPGASGVSYLKLARVMRRTGASAAD